MQGSSSHLTGGVNRSDFGSMDCLNHELPFEDDGRDAGGRAMPDDCKKTKEQLPDGVQELPVCASSNWRMVSFTLLILGLVGSGIPLASANEDVTLHLQWYHQFQFAGYYAAQERGFFREVGLDVTIVEGGPGTENFKAVLSAPGNYGTAHAAGLLQHRANGEPLVVLTSIFQHSPNAIIARADRGIRNPHDLVPGRTIIWPGGHVELSAMLLSEGVSSAPFLHESGGSHLQDLLDGKIDAIDGYVTNEALTIRKAGVPIVIISPVTYGVDFYGDVLMTSEREVLEYPGRARAFRAASLRGWEYAMEHPQEIVELLLSEYATKTGREHLLSEAEATEPLVLNPLVEIGHTNPGRWQRMANTLAALDVTKTSIQAEDFLFDPNPDMDLTKVYLGLGIALVIATVIGALAFVLLHFNRRLRREVFERKRDEEKLRESEGRFRSLSDAAFEGIAITHEGRIVDANGAFIDMFGYGLEELVGQEAQMLVAPEDHQLVTSRILSGYEKPYEHKAIHRDGSIIEVETHGRAFLHGGRQCRITAVHDITERKRAEKEQQAAEQRFKALFEQSGTCCMILDPNTSDGIPIIVDANKAACEAHGYSRAEFIGRTVADVDDQEGKRMCLERTRLMLSGKPLRVENTHVRKDGTMFPVAVYADRVDIEGEPPLIFSTEHDITERKRAEEALRTSESSLKALVEGVQTAIVVHDSSGKTVLSNQMAKKLLEPLATNIGGRELSDPTWCFFYEDGSEMPIEEYPVSRILETREAIDGLLLGIRDLTGGEMLWLLLNGIPIIDENGHLSKVIMSFVDITQRKRIEAEREKAIIELREALERIKTLHGIIPICAHCKKIRDDKGYWHQVEIYVRDHSDAEFSHSLCVECIEELYPDESADILSTGEDKNT